MNKSLNEIYRNEKHYENLKHTLEGCAPNSRDKSGNARSKSDPSSTVFKSRSSKTRVLKQTENNELYWTVQAILLASSVLVLSYNGAIYGRSEYSLLDNGQTVNGFFHSNRAVVTFSLGYSAPYSAISSIAALMLLYSLVLRKPSWSLPSMVLCLADLVCDLGDAVVAIWLFFSNLRFATAVLYTVGTIVIILGEFWIWLGVLQLYEYRTF